MGWNFWLFAMSMAVMLSSPHGGVQAQALVDQQALGTASSSAVALVDWDGDGDLDAIVTNAPPELKELWVNDGRGRFALFSASNGQYDVFPPFYATQDRDVDVGDLDGDGLPDAVFPVNGVYFNRLAVNPNGTIVLNTQRADLPGPIVQRTLSRLVDLDGDGDLDVFVGRGFFGGCCEDLIILNSDGAGALVATNLTLGPLQPTTDAVFRDIDGDGSVDAILCHGFFSNATVWRSYNNDGTANFTKVGEIDSPCDGLDIGDIDADGFDDLILVEFGGDNSIWRGFGNFTFQDTGLRPGNSSFSTSVRLGDLDGDGDLDAVISNSVGALITGEPSEVLINDGTGDLLFLPPDPLSAPDGGILGKWFSNKPALGDFDADGTLDLFEANAAAQPNRVYKNVGSGLSVVDPAANDTVGANVVVRFDSTAPNFIMTPLGAENEDGVRITLNTIRETLGSNGPTLKEIDVASQTFTVFDNPNLGDAGFDFLGQGALGEQYAFRFSLFRLAARISFGAQTYDVDADVNKITLRVGFWPFANVTTSRLEFDAIIQPAVPGSFIFLSNATDPGAASQGLERTIFRTSRGSAVVMSLLDTVAVDGLITTGFTRRYIKINDSHILLRLGFPAFQVELEYDPDVAVLVDTKGGGSGGQDNTLMIALISVGSIVVVVAAALLIPVAICALFVWRKHAGWISSFKERNTRLGSVVFSAEDAAGLGGDEYENGDKISDDDVWGVSLTPECSSSLMETLEPLEETPPSSART